MLKVFRSLLFLASLVMVTTCASRSPTVATLGDRHGATTHEVPSVIPSSNAATSANSNSTNASVPSLPATSAIPPCEKAAQQRSRVPGLLTEGKLHRTLRVIDHANQLCPSTAPQTWIPELQALAEIGRYKAARELAAKILANPPSPEPRAAVEQVLKLAAERDVTKPGKEMADTDEAKRPMRNMWRKAEAAADARKYKEASRLFEEAWKLWHPKNGRALAAAGRFAKRADDLPRAQRLFDRAVEELERQSHAVAMVDLPTSLTRVQAIAWSPTEPVFAATDGGTIIVIDAITKRDKLHLRGEGEEFLSIAFSPDGKQLASGSADNTVRLWRIADGSSLGTFKGHKKGVAAVTFSPDGNRLASGSFDTTIRIWQLSDKKVLHVLEGHQETVSAVAFSPDGGSIVSSSLDGYVRQWRTTDGQMLRATEGTGVKVLSVRYSPHGKTFATSSADGSITLWNAANGMPIRSFVGHKDAVRSLEFSRDGSLIASGSWDGTIRLWRVIDSAEVRTFVESSDPVQAVSFSPDGKALASSSFFGDLRLWKVTDGTLMHSFQRQRYQVMSSAFSPRGDSLAVGFPDGAIRLLQLSNGDVRLLGGHSPNVTSIGHSPNGPTIKSGLFAVASVAYSPGGQMLASGSFDKTVRLWRLSDGTFRTLEGHQDIVFTVAFSPDGSVLASGSGDNTIRLWRVSDGALIRALDGHRDALTSIAFSPDGKTLASASKDTTVRLWRISDGSPIQVPKEHGEWVRSVAFSPDGDYLISGARDDVVRFWRLSTGMIALFRPKLGSVAKVSPDGESVFTAAMSGEIRLWHVSDDTVTTALDNHRRRVDSLDLSPNGKHVVSSSFDGMYVRRSDNLGHLFRFSVLEDRDAQITISSSNQQFDVKGSDSAWAVDEALICQIGSIALPAELCAERAYVPGLWAKLMSGDPTAFEP